MEQLIYTSCRNGLGSGSGNMVRAATRGLKDLRSERYARLSRYLRYNLPAGANPNTTKPAEAPRNLALLDAGPDRILLHQFYVGLDYTGMRYGNHLSQLLLVEARELTPAQAIGLWGSPFWARGESDVPAGTYDLPPVSVDDLPPGVLTRERFAGPRGQTFTVYLALLLRAYLLLPEDRKICIAAPSETVAELIWALIGALPHRWTRDLTFATYTDDVLALAARIVGTGAVVDGRSTVELPAAAAGEKAWGLNCYTGKVAPLPAHPLADLAAAYAGYAAPGFVAGATDFAALLTVANQNPQWSKEEFLRAAAAFAAVCAAAEPAPADIGAVLDVDALAGLALSKKPVQRLVVQACATADDWWTARGKHRLSRLAQVQDRNVGLPEALAALELVAVRACQAALRTGETGQAQRVYDEVLRVIAEDGAAHAMEQLAAGLTVERVGGFEARAWVLERVAQLPEAGQGGPLDARMAPWLACDWEQLHQLLPLRIPDGWRSQAFAAVLVGDEPLDDGKNLIAQHSAAFRRALAELAGRPETVGVAVGRFHELTQLDAPGKLDVLGALVGTVRGQPGEAEWARQLVEAAELSPADILALAGINDPLLAQPGVADQLAACLVTLSPADDARALFRAFASPHLLAALLEPALGKVEPLAAGVVADWAGWTEYGWPHLSRVMNAHEPAALRERLARLADALMAEIDRGLQSRRTPASVKRAFDVFLNVAKPLAGSQVAALERFAAGVLAAVAAEQDPQLRWELRAGLIREAKEVRPGVSPAQYERVDNAARPALQLGATDLVPLALLLFDLAGPSQATARDESRSFRDSSTYLNDWLLEGERAELRTLPRAAFDFGKEIQAGVSKYERWFREALLRTCTTGQKAPFLMYAAALWQARPLERVNLLADALTTLSGRDDLCEDFLRGVDFYDPEKALRSPRIMDQLLAKGEGAALLGQLNKCPTWHTLLVEYLYRLRLEDVSYQAVRNSLDRIRASGNAELQQWAAFWLSVAALNDGDLGAGSDVGPADEYPQVKLAAGYLGAIGGKLDPATVLTAAEQILGRARTVELLRNQLEMLAWLNLPLPELAGAPSARRLYTHFLNVNRRPTARDEARRLAPYIALAVSRQAACNPATQQEYRAAARDFLSTAERGLLGDLDDALRSLTTRLTDVLMEWKTLKGELPAEARFGGGLMGGIRKAMETPRDPKPGRQVAGHSPSPTTRFGEPKQRHRRALFILLLTDTPRTAMDWKRVITRYNEHRCTVYSPTGAELKDRIGPGQYIVVHLHRVEIENTGTDEEIREQIANELNETTLGWDRTFKSFNKRKREMPEFLRKEFNLELKVESPPTGAGEPSYPWQEGDLVVQGWV